MNNLTNIPIDDENAISNISSRISLLSGFKHEEFETREYYFDENKKMFDEFKELSEEERDEVINTLQNKMFALANV